MNSPAYIIRKTQITISSLEKHQEGKMPFDEHLIKLQSILKTDEGMESLKQLVLYEAALNGQIEQMSESLTTDTPVSALDKEEINKSAKKGSESTGWASKIFGKANSLLMKLPLQSVAGKCT